MEKEIRAVPEELKQKVIDAVRTGKYFITISCKVKDKAPNDLQHYYVTDGYPKDELRSTLRHYKGMIKNKEFRGVGSEWR